MLGQRLKLAIIGAGLALGGCSFNGGGVSEDDAPAIDASGPVDDRDDDGVPDDFDNCPDDANAAQYDEDGDEIGNVCDNCPHVGNDDQANDGEDGAGDACDPDADRPGNDILLFEGFDDTSMLDGSGDWSTFNGGGWDIEDGTLLQTSTQTSHVLFYSARQFTGGILEGRFTLDDVPAEDTELGFGLVLDFSVGPGQGAGYYCNLHDYTNPPAGRAAILLQSLNGQNPTTAAIPARALGGNVELGETYDLQQVQLADDTVSCAVTSPALASPFEISGTDSTYSSGLIGIRTLKAAISVDYLVVYGPSTGN